MAIYHKHHIIPKHMGGTDDPSNLVTVTIEEHAALHKQLWEDLGHQEDRIAWLFLSGQVSSQEAIKMVQKLPKSEETKKKMSISTKKRKDLKRLGHNLGKNNIGRKASLSTKKLMSEKRSGEKNAFFGKKHDVRVKNILSQDAKSRKWYNNGIMEKRSKSPIPGWNLGRIK